MENAIGKDLKIDPEFQSKIPPLTEAEYKQLEENILTAGEVYEPITVWQNIIIDGHNRYKIIQSHPEIRWHVREMEFQNKWAAFDWMYKNQLGRRNLTDAQKTYLLGKLYESRKHVHGETQSRQPDGTFGRRHPDANGSGRVRDQLMQEQHVGSRTVQRSEHYAHGIDAIREEEPELAEAILSDQTDVMKKDVQTIGTADPADRPSLIDSLKREGRLPPMKQESRTKEVKKDDREDRRRTREDLREIRSIADELFEPPAPLTYTLDSLLRDIHNNAVPFVRLFRQIAEDNRSLCSANKEAVRSSIHENVTLKMMELEKEIEGYE